MPSRRTRVSASSVTVRKSAGGAFRHARGHHFASAHHAGEKPEARIASAVVANTSG